MALHANVAIIFSPYSKYIYAGCTSLKATNQIMVVCKSQTTFIISTEKPIYSYGYDFMVFGSDKPIKKPLLMHSYGLCITIDIT